MNTNLTSLSPAEVDALWLDAIQPALRAQAAATATISSARRYLKAGGAYTARGNEMLARGNEALAAAEAAYDEASAPFAAEYDARGGWNRYLMVANSNGHLHRGWAGTCHCHTLQRTTWVAPVPALSGMSNSDVVAEMKHTACSVCFPDAPVLTTADRKRMSAEAKAAKQAEREAKAAAKAAAREPRDHALAIKVNAIFDAYGTKGEDSYGSGGAYDAWCAGTIKDTPYYVWSDVCEAMRMRAFRAAAA